jgi:DNA-binding CsgD family transcriptional regulator
MQVTAPHASPLDRLHEDFRWTPRQRQVLDLLAARHTNGEIATALGISLDGAKWHVSEVMTKLGTNSRDQAAEYWRAYNRLPLRFSRTMRGLVVGLALRKVAVGAGVITLVGVATLGILLLAGLGDGDPRPTLPDGTPSPTLGSRTPQTSPTSAETPAATPSTTQGTDITPEPLMPVSLLNTATVPTDNGLLYVDLDTGDMTFWPMPGEYNIPSMSRDGRWIIWATLGGTDLHLMDTADGTDQVLQLRGEDVIAARLSDDGDFLMQRTPNRVALTDTQSGGVLAESIVPAGNANGWGEFASNGSVAIGFGPEQGPRGTLILHPDGTTAEAAGASWPLRWSPDATRLAVTTETSTRIVSSDAELLWEIPFLEGGNSLNPRWAPNGDYLAIPRAGGQGGYRVFDTATQVELLRTVGSPTCLDYWNSDGTLDFAWDGRRLNVTAGDILPPDPSLAQRPFDYVQTSEVGLTRLRTPGGRTIDFRSDFWSVYFDQDGIYETTTDGRAFFLIGVGGRGLCGEGELPEPEVLFPPF